jgi:hypothetical protein
VGVSDVGTGDGVGDELEADGSPPEGSPLASSEEDWHPAVSASTARPTPDMTQR